MDKNTRTLKMENNTITFYDYYITNACVIKFIDKDLKLIKDFFGDTIHKGLQELDKDGKIIAEEIFYFQRKNIFIENTIIVEKEIKIIKEPYDETIFDEITQENIIVHHEAETQTIEHKIPVEMITVTLEKPELQDEVNFLKNEINELKSLINTPVFVQNSQAKTLMSYVACALPDDKIIEVPNYVPKWEVGMNIKADDRVSVECPDNELSIYKCKKNKDHLSSESNRPGEKGSSSIWQKL